MQTTVVDGHKGFKQQKWPSRSLKVTRNGAKVHTTNTSLFSTGPVQMVFDDDDDDNDVDCDF